MSIILLVIFDLQSHSLLRLFLSVGLHRNAHFRTHSLLFADLPALIGSKGEEDTKDCDKRDSNVDGDRLELKCHDEGVV